MKKFSSKRSVQMLAYYLRAHGIQDIIISPGSRNAPLAIQFAEDDVFHAYSIVDERSAAFVALGMSMASGRPTAITCTSGSAAANYYPAVTEAFYQNIPLLLLTADRPTDYVDIFDGQTIRQKNLYQQHSYGNFELLEDGEEGSDLYNQKQILQAIQACIEHQGPVHINIPLAEPLYELTNEKFSFEDSEIHFLERRCALSASDIGIWNTSKRILILAGSLPYSSQLNAQLLQLVKNHSAVVLCEAGSNLHEEKFFHHIDRYIFSFDEEDFRQFAPDLLITIGQNVVSKKVKEFLRKAAPKEHWHIDPYWQPDTYFSLTKKFPCKAEDFFSKLLPEVSLNPQPYYLQWDHLRDAADQKHLEYMQKIGFSDLKVFSLLPNYIPKDYAVHISNSSCIRYAQLFDFSAYDVYCNRGTSGIDGCTSTAMGFAMKSPKPTLLITGDISFFYDINGLWNPYVAPYTRIILLNNHEGNIFKIIPGPRNAQENVLHEFITTQHDFSAKHLAVHFDWQYSETADENELERILERFFTPGPKPRILEINTSEADNALILRRYFNSDAV